MPTVRRYDHGPIHVDEHVARCRRSRLAANGVCAGLLMLLCCGAALAADNALRFDGNVTTVVTATGPDLATGKTFTIECWARRESTGTSDVFVGQGDTNAAKECVYFGLTSSNEFFVAFIDAGSVGTSASTYTDLGWHHYAITYDNRNVKGYRDGAKVIDYTINADYAPNHDRLTLGVAPWNLSSFRHDGSIDEVRVWTDVRTEAELRANMHTQLVGNEANLAAYYKLDTGTGSTAVDSSAGGHDGSISVGYWQRSGAIEGPGYALDCDGVNDYATVANASALIANASTITLEGWVYPRTATAAWPAFEGYFGVRDNSGADFYVLQLDDQLETRFRNSNGTEFTGAGGTITANTWHHIAMVYDGSTLKTYVDGLLTDTQTGVSGQITDGTVPLHIGYLQHGANDFYLDGLVDEVRLWTIARSATEIRDNMCQSLNGDEANLVAYYRADVAADASATTLYDHSASGADGTLTNMDAATDRVASTAFNTWTGSADYWNESANWSRGAVPVASDNIGIPNLTGNALASQPAVWTIPTVNHCVVATGGGTTHSSNLTVNGNLFVHADVDLKQYKLIVAGECINTADIAITYGQLDCNGPYDGGSGSITFTGCQYGRATFGDTFDFGTLNLDGCSRLRLDGSNPQTLTGVLDFDTLEINNPAGVDASTATLTVSREFDIYDGTFIGGGDFANVGIFGAAMSLSSDATVSGDWICSGDFAANGFTVELDGANQTIAGDTTFHTLTKTVSAADTLAIYGDSIITVTNNLTLKGAAGELLTVVGESDGKKAPVQVIARGKGGDPTPGEWTLDPPDGGTIDMQYLDLTGCKNVGDTIDLSDAHCVNTALNTNLIFAWPTVSTQTVGNIAATTATGNGTLAAIGDPNDLQHGVCWSTASNPTIADSKTEEGVPAATGAFTSTLTGLTPGQKYYVRAYVTDSTGGTHYGNSVSFTTATVVPTVTTAAATNVGPTSADAGGTITDDGGGTIVARGVCWTTSGNPTVADNEVASDDVTATFSVSITGLAPDTTYYLRTYAENSAGVGYGTVQSFTTSDINLPTVTTADVAEIDATSATAGGTVTSDGGATVTARGVCWNTAGEPTLADDFTDDGVGVGAFISAVDGLSPGVTYYVRAYATNSLGTSYGAAVTFTAGTRVPTVTTAAVSDIAATSATCGGEVAHDGGSAVLAYGVCWNTAGDPTIDDNATEDGDGTGSFVSALTNLSPSITYYVRAYAVNAVGAGYGETRTFVAAGPDLRVAIKSSGQAAAVGQQIGFQVDVQNAGAGDASDVVLRFALPPNTVFIGAWLMAATAAQDAPLDAYVEGDEIVVALGNVTAAADLAIELVLEAKSSGVVKLEGSVTSAEQPDAAPATASPNIEVDDVYWRIVEAPVPLGVCGWMGLTPALLLVGMLGLKRRQWRRQR